MPPSARLRIVLGMDEMNETPKKTSKKWNLEGLGLGVGLILGVVFGPLLDNLAIGWSSRSSI